MIVPADLKKLVALPAGSLTATIAELARQLCGLQQALQQAHTEIDRLNARLASHQQVTALARPADLPALRRRVAYYCHPDRGGDGELMSTLNRLFDALEAGLAG